MFCPKCAAPNLEGAKFCRACGADIRLVPQALAGQLVPAPGGADAEAAEFVGVRPTLDVAVQNIFKGLAFLLIVVAGLVYLKTFWVTIWFIIPALSSFGEGIGQLIRARQERLLLTSTPHRESVNFPPATFAPAARELASPDTAEIVGAPPSVTEMTTRHLDSPSKMP